MDMIIKKYFLNYLGLKMGSKSGTIFEFCNSQNITGNDNVLSGNSLNYSMNSQKTSIKLIKERIKAGYYDSEEIIEQVVKVILLDVQLKS